MRPVRRGASPRSHDYDKYQEAKVDLVARLGSYCSYCERRIPTNLAVEHIQHKDTYPHLRGRWTNFLLACVNCNSIKSVKEVLPDRDNTFTAFLYKPDGRIAPAQKLSNRQRSQAHASLALTGLDRKPGNTLDANGQMIALDRGSQRMETWAIAAEARKDIAADPNNHPVKTQVIQLARAQGHFSIWMAVFDGDAELRNRLIDAFEGTRESGCFDPVTTDAITPAPNPDGLPLGAKI